MIEETNVIPFSQGPKLPASPAAILMTRVIEDVLELNNWIDKTPSDAQTHTYGEFAASLLKERRYRNDVIDGDMLGDPAWDMLLDLLASEEARKAISVSSLCLAAGVPPTTALRWIRSMTEKGALLRRDDHEDKRKVFLELTPRTREALQGYLRKIAAMRNIMLADRIA
jgi:DNA-binding MarR family transcriptional regulator